MPKIKSSHQEILSQFDRPPTKEGFYDKLRGGLASIAEFYGYEKIFTPVLENSYFFQALIKEGMMLDTPPVFCKTRSGEEFILKPAGALSVLRAYFAHRMYEFPHPLKLLFDTQVFFSQSASPRRTVLNSASVAGRSEYGLLMIGEEGPVAEAQIIQLIWKGLQEAGIKVDGLAFRVNAVGCLDCRSAFRSPFMSYLRNRVARFCRNCKKYIKRMPTRVLLCEEEKCRVVLGSAPQVLDFLCDLCKKHLTGFLEFLDEMKIPYFLDAKLFKDGSPFNMLVFELVINPEVVAAGGEKAVESNVLLLVDKKKGLVLAEGGRLSRAGELMSGKKIEVASGVIFFEALDSFTRGFGLIKERHPKVFFTHLGELAKRKGMMIIEELRAAGIETQESLGRDSIKSQLKVAERVGAEVALLLGQKEALDGTIIVRETGLGVQETIPQEKLVEFLKKKLKK